MKTRPQRNFSPEFRLEAAQLVVDQNYTAREAADAMNVGFGVGLNKRRSGERTSPLGAR